MFESKLIEHCSPVLASLKTANMFNYFYDDFNELRKELCLWNENLKEKGIIIEMLRVNEEASSALIYVYRNYKLENDLMNPKVKKLLSGFGYVCSDVRSMLDRLRDRLANGNGFPHEIGVFLGYPVDDVISFIEDGGKHSKCCGCWQVYHNEETALREFRKFHKCKKIYKNLFKSGSPITKLAVGIF